MDFTEYYIEFLFVSDWLKFTKNVDLNAVLMLSKNQQWALIQQLHCDPVQFFQTCPVSQVSSCPLKSGLRLLMAFQTHNVFCLFFWQDWVFFALRGFSLVVASGIFSSLWCMGFSLRWLLLLWGIGSRHTGFSSCSRLLSSWGTQT